MSRFRARIAGLVYRRSEFQKNLGSDLVLRDAIQG
jgi:hypothetical protein